LRGGARRAEGCEISLVEITPPLNPLLKEEGEKKKVIRRDPS